ncbi:MAG: sigma-70 family RNA polymerase sigma factor [Deltaproteobacteria bacterium]|nr:sigma-70 family RNA polymerase sigma factor [Deltaproteobacteria bacterium]
MNAEPPAPITESDAALLQLALSGRSDYLGKLVERWTPVIQARVVRVLKRQGYAGGPRIQQEVEEFVQQVFVSLFESRGEALRAWKPERGLSLDNWVGLIAERQVLSLVRTRKRNPWTEEPVVMAELDGASQEPGPEDQALSRDVLGRLLDRLQERVSPLGWRLFQLLFLQELEIEEIAQRTNLTAAAIYAWRSRLRRLARSLRSEILSETEVPSRIPDQGYE